MKRMVLSICGFLAVIFLLQGCSWQSGSGRRHDPVPVRVTVVERSADAASRSYVGTVRPSKSVVLSCPYSGTLKTFAARRGDAVTKGEVLADVESQAVRSSWKMAHAALEQAEDGYRRLMQVHETGSVTDVKVVEVKTQLDRARASAEAADSALAACKVKAPFSGVVSDVFAEEGVELSPAEPLVRLLDVSSLEIEISVAVFRTGCVCVSAGPRRSRIFCSDGYQRSGGITCFTQLWLYPCSGIRGSRTYAGDGMQSDICGPGGRNCDTGVGRAY